MSDKSLMRKLIDANLAAISEQEKTKRWQAVCGMLGSVAILIILFVLHVLKPFS